MANKYHAKKTEYNGVLYDSKREATKAYELDLLVRAKEIKSWDRQEKISLRGRNGSLICHYLPDFSVIHLDGSKEIIEIKSKPTMTSTWRLKWKLLQDKLKFSKIKLTVET